MNRTDTATLRAVIGGECDAFVCRCCYTKFGWAHQLWCKNIWLTEASCEGCQYYDRQNGRCGHPALRREQQTVSAGNKKEKTAKRLPLVGSDKLNEEN